MGADPGFGPLPQDGPPAGRRLSVCVASFELLGPMRNSGGATACTTLARSLARAGHAVTLLYANGRHCENETADHWIDAFADEGIEFVPLESDEGPLLDCTYYVSTSYRAYEWLRRRRFDLVHFMDFGGLGYYSLLAKHQGLELADTLLCVTAHGSYRWSSSANLLRFNRVELLELDWLERRSVELADVLISPSRYLLEWMRDAGWKLPSRSHVQQNVLPDYARRPLVDETALPRKVHEVVFFGRLEERKGVVEFCDALDRLAGDDRMQLTATFLGKDGYVNGTPGTEYVRERARSWRFEWQHIGDYDETRAMQYLAGDGRLAVIASLRENSPYVVLECLGARLPFVASRVGGTADLIEAGAVERLTFPVDADSLTESIRRCCAEGAQAAAPAVDVEQNERQWLRWHETLDTKCRPAIAGQSSTPTVVSVCVSHHERPRLLGQLLDSVAAQDHGDIELVVVDDGSRSEEALRFLGQLEEAWSRGPLKVVRQANRYLGAARNAAVRAATGDYVVFMDDDDVMKPHMVSSLLRVARGTGAEIVTCACDKFPGAAAPPPDAVAQRRFVPLGAAPAVGVLKNCFGPASFLIRRERFEQLGGFSEVHGAGYEDWELLARAALADVPIEAVPVPLFWYRIGHDGMTETTHHLRNLDRCLGAYREALPAELVDLIALIHGLDDEVAVRGRELAELQRRADLAERRAARLNGVVSQLSAAPSKMLAGAFALLEQGASEEALSLLEAAQVGLLALDDGKNAAEVRATIARLRSV